MLRIRHVHFWCLRTLYLLSQLCGLMTATRHTRARRRCGMQLSCSWYWRLHGYLVLAFVACFSPYAVYVLYTRMEFLRLHELLLTVGFHRYVHLLCSTLLMLYMHITKQRNMVACMNGLLRCRRQLLQLLQTSHCLRKSALELHTVHHLLTLYLLIVSIVCSCGFTLFILRSDSMAQRSFGYVCSVLFFHFCQLAMQLCLGLYLLALLLIGHLAHHCNLHLARLLTDAVHSNMSLITQSLARRQRLHEAQQRWLAFELWRLWQIQAQLLQLSRCLCSLHRPQLLAFVMLVTMECVVHGFFTYFVEFSHWYLRTFGEPEELNYYAFIFIAGFFLQLVLLLIQMDRQRCIFVAARATLRISALALPVSCGKALLQTLHLYGLQLQFNERTYHLTACGLFELNNELLFGIMQTIIIYIMILIQFDKIINI